MNVYNLIVLIGISLLPVTLAVADSIPTQSSEVDFTPAEGNAKHTTYFLLQINTPLIQT